MRTTLAVLLVISLFVFCVESGYYPPRPKYRPGKRGGYGGHSSSGGYSDGHHGYGKGYGRGYKKRYRRDLFGSSDEDY